MSRNDPAVQPDHDAVIGAWLALEPRDRQLAVLRLSFPQWAITHEYTANGWAWVAVLPTWHLTEDFVAVGVLQRLERTNPVALMADLSTQRNTIHYLTPRRT
ncbi:hypothetical protein AB0I81_40340 [Nonomuraea sp. NPDC050404]|uniref:hypothetical protein n=1 Tax=Nonomuraea sp. NPDC050404 TaxID=3155783 RepID=UPI0033EB06C8